MSGNDLSFPFAGRGATLRDLLGAGVTLDDRGRITLDLEGALYTTPDNKLRLRTSKDLVQAGGSPVQLMLAQPPTVQVKASDLATLAQLARAFAALQIRIGEMDDRLASVECFFENGAFDGGDATSLWDVFLDGIEPAVECAAIVDGGSA